MNWQEYYEAYEAALCKPADARFRALEAARRRVATNDDADWVWLREALVHPEKRWFVAGVFERQPVPKRLLHAFIQAAVTGADASHCAQFVKPCTRSYGRTRVANALLRHLEEGTPEERDGAEKAMYWCGTIDGTVEEQDAFRARYRRALKSAGLVRPR